MSMRPLLGDPVAATLREDVRERVAALRDRGHTPTLGTVLMSNDPAHERFMDLKHDACAEVGIETRDHRLDPDVAPSRLYRTVDRLSAASAVDAVFVQTPLPPKIPTLAVGRRLDPRKDVDCFHPENVGRLVAGDARFEPATTAAVVQLLAAYEVPTAGRDVVIVGRSNTIGKPLANRLLERGTDATVTVCHSRTRDLGAKTRQADVVVTACGVPELLDGSMLSPGVVVVDVSVNRRTDTGAVVGDVEAASAREVASAITPVPGGVGPVTLAALLGNVVEAAERRVGRTRGGTENSR